MKINVQNSLLGLTAGLVSQFPNDNRPQIVFSGRSNVGKSSLINTLLGRKNLARVSSAPGKTITVNFYDIDKKIWFVDIPGYGYAKRDFKDKKRWSALTDNFLTSPVQKRLILQLIDMKVGPTEDDYMMLDWLDESETPYVIVATKCDKLNKTETAKMLESITQEIHKYADVDVIPFSSLKGTGVAQVREQIEKALG